MFRQIRVGMVTGDAVKATTGKTWDQWCRILDRAGGRMMEHKEIARVLQKQHGLTPWWSKTVAVGYRNERGIRRDEQGTPTGWSPDVTMSKIVNAPRAAVWAAWQDPGTLAQWLGEAKFHVLKTAPLKSMQLNWPGQTRVTVRFNERAGKTRVTISQSKVPAADADSRRDYWSGALERLKAIMAR